MIQNLKIEQTKIIFGGSDICQHGVWKIKSTGGYFPVPKGPLFNAAYLLNATKEVGIDTYCDSVYSKTLVSGTAAWYDVCPDGQTMLITTNGTAQGVYSSG